MGDEEIISNVYVSKVINHGFKLRGEDGTNRPICPRAEYTVNPPGEFFFEIDHGKRFNGILIDCDPDTDGHPLVRYYVPDEVHELIKSGKLKGVSPVIDVNKINQETDYITGYRLVGMSLQVEAEPVCPSGFCPTRFEGGKDMTEDIDKKTEDKPKEEPVKKTENRSERDEKAELIAKLLRDLESTKRNNEELNKQIEVINLQKREEMLKLIPEDQRDMAKALDMEALATVTSILKTTRDTEAAQKKKADEDTKKKVVIQTGAQETVKKEGEDKGSTQKTTTETEDDAYNNGSGPNYFDRSSVIAVIPRKVKLEQ
jgi:hypothetical protein